MKKDSGFLKSTDCIILIYFYKLFKEYNQMFKGSD